MTVQQVCMDVAWLDQALGLQLLGEALPRMPRGKAKKDGEEVEWVLGTLATAWEGDNTIRCRGRNTQSITRWASPKTRGIPSMKNIDLCCDPLLHIATHWCPIMKEPKSPPVPLLRAEAGVSKSFILLLRFVYILWVHWFMTTYAGPAVATEDGTPR